jgi:hypothetical protein
MHDSTKSSSVKIHSPKKRGETNDFESFGSPVNFPQGIMKNSDRNVRSLGNR